MNYATDAMICSQGTAQFGRSAHPLGSKVNTAEDAQNLVDVFISYENDKHDSSRIYGGGTSEEVGMHCVPTRVRNS